MQGRVSITGFDDGEGHVAKAREQPLVAGSGLQPTAGRDLILPTILMILLTVFLLDKPR